MSDPLDSKRYLLRIDDNEAIDGQNNFYHIEPKSRCEAHPLLIVFTSIFTVFLILYLTGCASAPEPRWELLRFNATQQREFGSKLPS